MPELLLPDQEPWAQPKAGDLLITSTLDEAGQLVTYHYQAQWIHPSGMVQYSRTTMVRGQDVHTLWDLMIPSAEWHTLRRKG